jgi:hypothetical protein
MTVKEKSAMTYPTCLTQGSFEVADNFQKPYTIEYTPIRDTRPKLAYVLP